MEKDEKIRELEERLEEAQQLIDAIRSGEVDAFALPGKLKPEVYTLQSGDYAYRLLIEEFGEGAINVTEEGLIVYCNLHFCELMKLPYDAVIGKMVADFVSKDSVIGFQNIFNAGLKGRSNGEIEMTVGESIIPVYISLTSLRPDLATVGIIITDLTEKKKNDEVLLKYQADLEQKNKELLSSNKELASFAYIASHDLQEPLRKIQTFASLIGSKEAANLSENGKDNFLRMQQAAKRMQTLIGDLLSYSRANVNETKLEETDLAALVKEVKEEFEEEFLSAKARLDLGKLCTVKVIRFQFFQLFYNLISNSIKFSDPGRPLVIRIESDKTPATPMNGISHPSFCHIRYTDNGIGFEPEFNERIFELFQRLHGKSEYEGTGIGLAIVKKIIDNHHGTITASGDPGNGARFDIYLPLS